MASYPSLFWRGEAAAPAVQMQTFIDCGLAPLLSATAIDWLARPAAREEIADRQALFTRLRGAAAPRFAQLGTALDTVAAARHAYANAATALEALFLRVALLRQYADVYPIVAAMAADGLLGPGHAAFWPMQADGHAALTAALPRLEEELTALSSVTLKHAAHAPTALTAPITDSCCSTAAIARRAAVCADVLGLALPPRRPTPRRLDDTVADAWLALHEGPAAALRMLSAGFDASEHAIAALSVCRDELAVCASVGALLDRASAQGCAVTLPTIADAPTYAADDLCDLALVGRVERIVPNAVDLTPDRRFFYLTGANGGGKTAYLRSLVSNLLLARAGCPIAASRACIYPWRDIATHFTADEAFTGHGRFVDEQTRADTLSARANADCFFCFNEAFSGTDHQKGLDSLRALVGRLTAAGVSGLCVTHFHDVADDGLPMLTTVIDAQDSAKRTYRIAAAAGCGSSFARDVLRKYRLDAASLAARLAEKEEMA